MLDSTSGICENNKFSSHNSLKREVKYLAEFSLENWLV